jgi:PKD domain-containing protein
MRKRRSGRLLGLAALLVFVNLFAMVPYVKATSGLVPDGNGFGTAIGSSCAWAKPLTTTNKSDVIIAMIAVNDTTTGVTSITDNAFLSWTLRASLRGPANVEIFYYYAIAPEPLSADNVTFTLSSRAVATVCQDFGISGADANIPFDPNSGMPNLQGGSLTSISSTYNTSNPNDFLIILEAFCAQGTVGSPLGSGFSVIGSAQNAHIQTSNCPSDYLQTNTYYDIVSATQSSNTVSWANLANSPFVVIGDAIQSAPGPLSTSLAADSSFVDVGQLASFSCSGAGGLSPYTYSWAFGDGSTGSGASTSHTYNTLGTMSVICTVTDLLGTSKSDGTQVVVISDPSIISFAALPSSLSAGETVVLSVSASGGYGPLTYSYANLPSGCLSANATTISCTPTSSGNYRVTVTVTDRTGESATSTAPITVGPERVLGRPQATGLAVIFGAIVGILAIVILSAFRTIRSRNRRQAPTVP